ncbi:hypothetical protein WY02_27895 [Pseudonocardia sp. AL041005-10]|nr:hypothetical protein WY02_27895 [Pseudonocardia sp. AL041005-10]
MQVDPLAPPVGERGVLVVGGEDDVEVRQPEQVQHREVGLAVPAVRGRVDQPRGAVPVPVVARTPQHVARPQVPVQPGRRLVRTGQGADPSAHVVDGGGTGRVEGAAVPGGPQVGQHPVGGEPVGPRAVVRTVLHPRVPDPRPRRPAGRRGTERVGTGGVQRRQLPAEPFRGGRRRPARGTSPVTRSASSAPSTRGTGGPPGTAIQRSPAASAVAAPGSPEESLTTTTVPSSRVARGGCPAGPSRTARPVSRATRSVMRSG